MAEAIARIQNPIFRWFAGLGILTVIVTVVLSALGLVIYSLGALTRWFVWTFLVTDHSPENLQNLYDNGSFELRHTFGLEGTYLAKESAYIVSLGDPELNIILGLFAFSVLIIVFIVVFGFFFGAHELGKHFFGSK